MMTAGTDRSESRAGLLGGFPARRVRVWCEHGESTFFVVEGNDGLANRNALDVVWVQHAQRHGCRCGPPAVGNPEAEQGHSPGGATQRAPTTVRITAGWKASPSSRSRRG